MAFEKKEKYHGFWRGESVAFNRVWGGHRFTDEECGRLLNDETVVIQGVSQKTGNPYFTAGRLARQSYNGHDFVGFYRVCFLPGIWCGHEFLTDELQAMMNGQVIRIDGLVSKKGNEFFATVGLVDNGEGAMNIQMFEYNGHPVRDE